MEVRPSIDVVRAHLAEWDSVVVEQDVFGTSDAAAICALTDTFCRQHLGAGIRGSLFYVSSIGCVHGAELEDDRRIVIKARPPAATNPDMILDKAAITSIYRVTSWLFSHGYPCPEPMLGPHPLGRGNATVEMYAEPGSPTDGFDPVTRKSLAAGLAQLLNILRSLPADIDVARLSPAFRGKVLFPQPHSKLFDFERTASGAEWIDEYARRARLLDTYTVPPILGHTDWRAEHVRFKDGAITAVFDWDSLGMRRETELVGIAAHAFTADWSRPMDRVIPNADEIRAFVDDYERERGSNFIREERASIFASAVYCIAYGARCGHALHPAKSNWEEGTFPNVLRKYGEELLLEAQR